MSCQTPDPRLITAYLQRVLELKFARAAHIDRLALREMIWHRDLQKSRLLITTRGRFDPTTAGQRPALVLKRTAVKPQAPLSIGDRHQSPTHLIGPGHDPNTEATAGQHQQAVAYAGGHVIFCLHGEEAAAEELALEVSDHLMRMKDFIRRDLGLHRFRPAGVEEGGELDEARENWAVPVVVEWSYQHSAVLRQDAPLLKRFLFR